MVILWSMCLLQSHVVLWPAILLHTNKQKIGFCNLSFIPSTYQYSETLDRLILLNSLLSLSACVPAMFLLCHLGQRITSDFDALNVSVYQVLWYRLPTQMQRNFVPILMVTQKSMVFSAIGELNCSHETFKRVNYSFTFPFVWLVYVLGKQERFVIETRQHCDFLVFFQILNAGYSYFMIFSR